LFVAAMTRHVHLERTLATDPLDDAALQHTQQLRLRLRAQITDFVEKQRAAVGRARSGPGVAPSRPVKAPRSCPNISDSTRSRGVRRCSR